MKFLSAGHSRSADDAAIDDAESEMRLEAKLPAALDARAAAGEVENEQLRCGRSTQYPRSVSTVAKREYRNCTFHTQ